MSQCSCGQQNTGLPWDRTDEVISALDGVRDLIQPSAEGRELDMVSTDNLYALMDLLLTQLKAA